MRQILFSYAFRPFFLLLGAFAVLIVAAWGLHLNGGLAWPATLPVAIRHGHEMIFGFGGAAIAGFLLTAVATWTGRPAVAGGRLILLSAAWVLARIGAFWPGEWGAGLWASASLLFWAGLLRLVSREVLSAENTRNYKVLAMLAAFLITESLFFLSAFQLIGEMAIALRMGLCLVIGMILLIGGRIIPNFTQNWLRLNRPNRTGGLPPFTHWDAAANAAFIAFACAFALWPYAMETAVAALVAAALLTVRLIRWRGWLAWREPLLWVLHVGFAWIPAGLALLGFAVLRDKPGLWNSGLHALGYGAIGTLVMGIAARAALGHTGRPLKAFPSMTAAFVMLTVGAALRVISARGDLVMNLSVVLWIGAYLLFLACYAPILVRPRIDSRRAG